MRSSKCVSKQSGLQLGGETGEQIVTGSRISPSSYNFFFVGIYRLVDSAEKEVQELRIEVESQQHSISGVHRRSHSEEHNPRGVETGASVTEILMFKLKKAAKKMILINRKAMWEKWCGQAFEWKPKYKNLK